MSHPLRLSADQSGITEAARLLRDGALVALPTETVYGLGADARNDRAVARIFEAKGRPSFNPLIVHVPDVEAARTYVHWTQTADLLASAFWPGALTLVLPLRADSGIAPLVSAGLSTVAVRVPAHPLAQKLLREFGGPIAAPSANRSGQISPTTPDHVAQGLGARVAAILDGGPCPVGVESSIVDATGTASLLRPGGIPAEALEQALGHPLGMRDGADAISAPGQLRSHYAPSATVRLNATDWREGEATLGFGKVAADLNLSPSGDLTEAAANLFGHLHTLDASGRPIAVAPIPMHGLGAAINDRLSRAAAPRD
ncbi:L-threonylcarbamoyladenylate synthase [Primorskyibacter marinus]|uniref:L-threonylcarbamoyladenylate synthase n=1 Tax=Primorskyibacter marinus TaxID=1977320 RepID=UPI000E3032E8|nr:L-threonylcarbamoyladenylate synthase [Primorskyibacter marinus]